MGDDMTNDFAEKYKEILTEMAVQTKEFNIKSCSTISIDLTRMSVYFNFSEGVFISEFLEYLFDNLNHVVEKFEVEEKFKETAINEISELIEQLKEFITKRDETKKIKMYNKMRDVRYLITKTQLDYYRLKKPKKTAHFI
ncbi:MAG: hypothetical protein CHKLHMKO_00652 [Candidatus Argoarchaeum ethanivorans]|uniref:Uncharacterized protein n=1 Tax=Candidatus Argoarchaeum ethanivorans TaxID=2608793 RepID=A0A811TED0_9EURY|nr:MAG: hypothetical protein CHKLHMKO_00652 [Candidatus Argoarchaeum ethanivorans]